MTEYQKIENELFSLGWKKEQRSGDHFRFTKEGQDKFITVSKSISDKGRAIKNTYADIRKAEPRFSLGRQEHMLPETPDEDPEGDAGPQETAIPEGIAIHLAPGKHVRWTAPENRDWTRLDDPDSLMNKRYTVTGYKQTESGTMVLIQGDTSEEAFPVNPDELDMWNVQPCKLCGRRFPKNRLATDHDGKYLCQDCAESLLSEIQTGKKAPSLPLKKTDPFEDLVQNDPKLSEIVKLIDELSALENTDAEPGPKTVWKRIELMDLVKERFQSLPAKTKKLLRKQFPGLTARFDEPEETKPAASLYQAWKESLKTLDNFRSAMLTDEEKRHQRKDLAALYSSTYAVSKLSGGKGGSFFNLITIRTGNWNTVLTIWRGTQILVRNLKPFLPDAPVAVLVTCPAAKFRQYAIDYDDEQMGERLRALKDILPEGERQYLSRVTRNVSLPRLLDTAKPIYEALVAKGCDFKKDTGFRIYHDVPDPEDADSYETAPAVIRTDILTGASETPGFDAICEVLRGLDFGPVPVICTAKDLIANRTETIDRTEGKLHTEDQPDETRTLLHLEQADGKTILVHDEEDRDAVVGALSDALLTDEFRSLLADAYRRTVDCGHCITIPGLLASPETKEKHKEMKETDILEQTNPESEFLSLRTLTTRTLLKELIARGVQFDNMTITVRKTITPDEI